MYYPSLAEFKSSVCATKEDSSFMSLPLIIAQIFNAPGCAFPEDMGKQTKLELTTVATHAAGTFLGAIIGVTIMILKGVGAKK